MLCWQVSAYTLSNFFLWVPEQDIGISSDGQWLMFFKSARLGSWEPANVL